MDLRVLGAAKDEASRLLIGESANTEATPTEVDQQVKFNKSMTLTPLAKEPEVTDTETPVHVPNLKRVELKGEENYKDAIDYRLEHIPHTIRRRPNRWLTLCNLDIPAGEIVTGWNPKIDMDSVLVFNQTGSAGSIYVAPTQSDLQGSPIRGKGLSAGSGITLEIEAGGYLYAPSGATVDIIILWYEDEHGKPV